MNTRKKIFLDVFVFIIIISITVTILIFKKQYEKEPVTRMEAIGYSIGYSDEFEEVTEITTTTTPLVTTKITTAQTTIETVTETETTTVTTEPLNETIIDHSNIQRNSLAKSYCDEVANLKNSNQDTRGWIGIPNTNISYAFTQTDNNSFYLDHDFYGNEDHAGWVFLDCISVFDDNGQQSDVATLYGHNMANGTMFSTLKRYRDNPDFYQSNPIITVSSVNNCKYYKIFAYMICNGKEGSDFEFWKFSDLSNPDDFYYYVNSAFRKSLIITGVDVQYGDKILALSTCNSGSSSNYDRFVVLARMVRDGEDLYEGCYRIR